MQFELKNVYTVGKVTTGSGTTMTQHVNITIGVVGCPYNDIKTERTVAYLFDENLTAKQVEDGIDTFATQWIAGNYPNI